MADRSVRVGGGLTIDVRDVRAFAKRLRAAEPRMYVGLRSSVRAAGEVVADEARRRSSEWSTRIPDTIAVRTSGGASVSVVAGGSGAPGAAALENRGKEGTFRHPVFGNRELWVEQTARPFLVPSVQAHQEEIAALVAVAVGAVIDRL